MSAENVSKEKKGNGVLADVMCRLSFHKWTYDKDTIVKCNKTCKCCGKKMHSSYDMCYGSTVWLNGHYW